MYFQRTKCTIPTDHIVHINEATNHGATPITGFRTTDCAYQFDGIDDYL